MSRDISYGMENIIQQCGIKGHGKKEKETWEEYDLRMKEYLEAIAFITPNPVNISLDVLLVSFSCIKDKNNLSMERCNMFTDNQIRLLSDMFNKYVGVVKSLMLKASKLLRVLKFLCISLVERCDNDQILDEFYQHLYDKYIKYDLNIKYEGPARQKIIDFIVHY